MGWLAQQVGGRQKDWSNAICFTSVALLMNILHVIWSRLKPKQVHSYWFKYIVSQPPATVPLPLTVAGAAKGIMTAITDANKGAKLTTTAPNTNVLTTSIAARRPLKTVTTAATTVAARAATITTAAARWHSNSLGLPKIFKNHVGVEPLLIWGQIDKIQTCAEHYKTNKLN